MQQRNAETGNPMSREQFWFFHPFRVRYSEIDGEGVVFNAHYLTYFDTTITEYFRALGYDQYADAKQTGEDFHVVRSVIEYKASVRFDWELDIGARVARIGNSSLTFELAIFRKGGNEALVTGEIIWVNTNQQTHRPVPISKAIRERIAALAMTSREQEITTTGYAGRYALIAGRKKIAMLIAKPMLQRIERSVGRSPR
jgi:acyl-CoA thioester hydrolase